MKWIVLLGFLLFAPSLSLSQVLLNEVYYDHPGSDTGREFIELIGTGAAPVALSAWVIEFHDGASGTWRSIWAGNAADTVYFDGLFVIGGSGVRPRPDTEVALGLQNGPDAVRLLNNGLVVDVLGYGDLASPDAYEGEPAPDIAAGSSLARWPDGFDSNDNLADFRASVPSPGSYNQARIDVSLLVDAWTPVRAVLAPGEREAIGLRVVNAGVLDFRGGGWVIARDSVHDGPVTVDSTWMELELSAGADAELSIDITPAFGYHDITVALTVADEREGNNRARVFRRVGGPRIIVSEVMSNPASACPEYIELFNDDAVSYDLAGFAFRDAVQDPVPIDGAVIAPGQWAVLTSDGAALKRCFPALSVEKIIEVSGAWPTLNHSGSGEADSVLILDRMLLPVDRVAYPGQPSDTRGRSLERVDAYYGIRTHTWVLSDAPAGGTPGERNTRSVADQNGMRGVSADPNPFDPYGSERLVIAVSATDASRVEASVYDLTGLPVIALGTSIQLPFVFVWDGRDQYGGLVAPGHYILACVFDDDQVESVVIACARRR